MSYFRSLVNPFVYISLLFAELLSELFPEPCKPVYLYLPIICRPTKWVISGALSTRLFIFAYYLQTYEVSYFWSLVNPFIYICLLFADLRSELFPEPCKPVYLYLPIICKPTKWVFFRSLVNRFIVTCTKWVISGALSKRLFIFAYYLQTY